MNHVFTFSAKAIEIKSELWQPNSQKNHDVYKKRQTNKKTLENYAVFASSPTRTLVNYNTILSVVNLSRLKITLTRRL